MGKDKVAIHPVAVISQLFVDSYRGSEILSPGTGTNLNKNNMSSD